MTSSERLIAMLAIIEKKEYCSVEFLAQTFGVSHMTIRRDLKELFNKDKILRCRGGAGAIKFNDNITPAFRIREQHRLEQKKKIALKASCVLKPGSVIFIDHSSTVIPLLKYITPEKRITVVTNGLRAFTELSEKKIKLYCTGGEYHNLEMAYFGDIAIKSIELMHFDACFFSPRGVISHDGVYNSSMYEAALLKEVINNSDSIYGLFSVNKLGDRFKYKLCDFSAFTEVFTDTDCTLKTLTE